MHRVLRSPHGRKSVILKSDLMLKMNRMESVVADFKAETWTFTAPYFIVGAGEYLIISKRDWDETWKAFEDRPNPQTPATTS